MPMMNYPVELPELAPGGLLRGLTERKLTSEGVPAPEELPGGALRQIVQEPLQKKLLPGVSQQYLETSEGAYLAQLEAMLKEANFTPEQAASLINAIITAPSRAGKAGAIRPTGRGALGGVIQVGKKGAVSPYRGLTTAQQFANLAYQARRPANWLGGTTLRVPPGPSRIGKGLTGGALPVISTLARGGASFLSGLGSFLGKRSLPIPMVLPNIFTGGSKKNLT